MEIFSMILVTIGAPIFDLSVYFDAKFESLEFLGIGEHTLYNVVDY